MILISEITIMFIQLLNYFFAAIFFLSIIVLIDLIIKFKHPFILKTMLMMMAISVGWNAFAVIYSHQYGYYRFIVEIPKVLMMFGGLNFFAILYLQHLKNKILVFTLLLIGLQLIVFFFLGFVYPVDPHINLKDVPAWRTLCNTINIVIIAIILVIIVDLYFKILKKYNADNLYFKKIRDWSFLSVLVINLLMVANLISNLNSHLENITIIIKGVAYIATLLFILYRPAFLNYTNIKITLSNTFNFKSIADFKTEDFLQQFFLNTYYLNKDASIIDLSDTLGINGTILLEYIEEHYELTFSELVNKHRVEYFVSLVSSGKYKELTTEALAEKAGFNSRQNLTKSFKKFHGGNPSDLIKSVGSG